MPNAFSKMEALIGEREAERLARAKVAVFGLGGVGSYAAEALARCGVGSLTLVDGDQIQITDINHQAFAFRSTVGRSKVETAREKIADIDDGILVNVYDTYFNDTTKSLIDFSDFDYVIDAINKKPNKFLIIKEAAAKGVPVITCVGAENGLDPSKIEITEIGKLQINELNPGVIKLKNEIRKISDKGVKLLYSKEKKLDNAGSIVYVPGIAGLMTAREIIQDLTAELEPKEKKPMLGRRGVRVEKRRKK